MWLIEPHVCVEICVEIMSCEFTFLFCSFATEIFLITNFVSRPDRSSVCVLRPVFTFCVLHHVRRKNNVRRHGKHGIY